MSQIHYNFLAMFDQAQNMKIIAGQLTDVANQIHQVSVGLNNAWQGNAGSNYQIWQHKWDKSVSELLQSYQHMAQIYESNANSMLATENHLANLWG